MVPFLICVRIGEVSDPMKQFLILVWIVWVQMLFVFGVPSVYFLRRGDWRGLISIPIFVVLLYAGWRLLQRSRRDWHQA